ncbi:MAG: glycosyltransferase family 1 protein [Planctomycetota bacterium]
MSRTNSDKPRLGIFTRPIDQGRSGSGKHADRLLTEFIRINDTFDLFFIHYEKSDHPIYEHGTEILIPRNPFKASRIIREYNLEIVHYHPLTVMSPVTGLQAKKAATIHGAAEDFIPDHYSLTKRLHSRLLKPIFSRKMDLIFTVSRTSQDYLSEQHRVDPAKFCVVYNAVDSRFSQLPAEDLAGVREKYTGGRRFVLHISNYSMRKNPYTVLKGFKKLRSEMPGNEQTALVIVGNGWDKDAGIAEFIEREGLKNDVVLPGYIPTDDIPRLLNLADVFVFPSLYEGFGMPNLEAMACGCPVITSGEFAIPEIVGDGALILETTTDADELAGLMQKVITDSQLRQSLIANGLEQVQKYSWNESAVATLEAYKRLL